MGATKMFGSQELGRDQRQIEARRQQRAKGEQVLRDADEYSAALKLFIVDAQLKAIVDAYVAMDHDQRRALAAAAGVA